MIIISVRMVRGWEFSRVLESSLEEVRMLMISCWERVCDFGVVKLSVIRRFWCRALGLVRSAFSIVRHSLVRGS